VPKRARELIKDVSKHLFAKNKPKEKRTVPKMNKNLELAN